jgi:hypothetical protein
MSDNEGGDSRFMSGFLIGFVVGVLVCIGVGGTFVPVGDWSVGDVPVSRAEPANSRVGAPRSAAAPPSGSVFGSAAADWSRWPVGTTFRVLTTGQLYRVDDYGFALHNRGGLFELDLGQLLRERASEIAAIVKEPEVIQQFAIAGIVLSSPSGS